MHRYLIINADGYGFTAGINRAIEECIKFGTVRSLSANVNFKHADRLADLVRTRPDLSVGCHLNPVVGRPLLPLSRVPTLVNEHGEFFYLTFRQRFLSRKIKLAELKAEMMAQVEKTRELVGAAFSHIDFHMGLHRLPGLYSTFLEVVEKSGVGRIRTHRYHLAIENRFPLVKHFFRMFESPTRIPKWLWDLALRKRAQTRHLVMPDRWVGIMRMGLRPGTITVDNYMMMLKNLPYGFNEFVVHPGYVDEDLKQWSTYISPRIQERNVLLSPEFRAALFSSDIRLVGYRDIPVKQPRKPIDHQPLVEAGEHLGG